MHRTSRDGSPLWLCPLDVAALKHDVLVGAIAAVLAAAIGFGLYALGHWAGLRQRDWVEAMWARPADEGWEPIDPESELGSRLIDLVGRLDPYGDRRPARIPVAEQIRRHFESMGVDVTVHGWRPYRDSFGRYVVSLDCDLSGWEYEPRFDYEVDLEQELMQDRYAKESRRAHDNLLAGNLVLLLLIVEGALVLGWQWLVLRTWDGSRDFVRAMPSVLTRSGRKEVVLPFPYRCCPA